MCKYTQWTSPHLLFLTRATHMAAREDVGQPSPPGEALEKPVGAEPRGPSPPEQTAPLFEEGWDEVGREDCASSSSLPANPYKVLASVGPPVGGPQSQPVGAEPEGPSPPDQTAPLSEGEWDEVGQETSSCDVSLPATPERVLASVGSPIGSPQSPSHALSGASGEDGLSDRASLDGGRPEASGPKVDGAMHTPPGDLLTTSPLALAAEGGLDFPDEGADGAAVVASSDAGLSAVPYVGPESSMKYR